MLNRTVYSLQEVLEKAREAHLEGVSLRLCFDVDGVVASEVGNLPYAERVPVKGVPEIIRELKRLGHSILYHTARHMRACRGDQDAARWAGHNELVWWLDRYDIPHDEVYFGKPSFDVMFDNKADRVESDRGLGDWANTVLPRIRNIQEQKSGPAGEPAQG